MTISLVSSSSASSAERRSPCERIIGCSTGRGPRTLDRLHKESIVLPAWDRHTDIQCSCSRAASGRGRSRPSSASRSPANRPIACRSSDSEPMSRSMTKGCHSHDTVTMMFDVLGGLDHNTDVGFFAGEVVSMNRSEPVTLRTIVRRFLANSVSHRSRLAPNPPWSRGTRRHLGVGRGSGGDPGAASPTFETLRDQILSVRRRSGLSVRAIALGGRDARTRHGVRIN